MAEKETITIAYYASKKDKTVQGIYQALKRKNNKYSKYLTLDEERKKSFL